MRRIRQRQQNSGGQEQPARPLPVRALRFREGRVGPWLGLGLAIFGVLLLLVVLGLSGRAVPLPKFVVEGIEARANRVLGGQAQLTIAGGDLVAAENFAPQIRLSGVTLLSAGGRRVARIEDLRASVSAGALLSLKIEPSRLVVRGARIALRRQADGALDVAPSVPDFSGQALVPSEALDALDGFFAAPTMANLQDISVEGLAILFDDRRAQQIWSVSDGMLTLTQEKSRILTNLTFDLVGQSIDDNGARPPAPTTRARASLSLVTQKASSAATLSADLQGIAARDLAASLPALAWLDALDAPISGTIDAGLDPDGAILPLSVALSLGKGALQPTPDTRPVPFDKAGFSLTYLPAKSTLTLSELSVQSPSLRANAHGQAALKGMEDGLPEAVVAQVTLTDLKADPEGIFADPVSIGQGAMDLKLTLDPFKLTIGQLTLVDQGQKITAKGEFGAEPKGWSAALDVNIDAIAANRLVALWPLAAVPKTREWIAQNVATGELYDLTAAMRVIPGSEPRLALGYQFRDADVRFMKSLPPIVGASGYATISDNSYVLVAEAGRVRAPKGGEVDIAGSVLKVPDIRIKPAPMEVTLKSDSTITAALALLDEPPFGFLTKAGLAVDLAQGRAKLVSVLKFTPKPKLMPRDVIYDVNGTLSAVSSDMIVKGRALASKGLALSATNAGLTISGEATLDGVALRGQWSQGFGPDDRGKSRAVGQIDLSAASLKAFAIGLPEGSVSGQGWGDFTLALARGEPGIFTLESALEGVILAIPEIGWQKPAGTAAKLKIAGAFALPTRIDHFSLSAPGLSANGNIILRAEGGLERADFRTLKLGDWFVGDASIIGQGKGQSVSLEVSAGEVDLRRVDFGQSKNPGAGPPLNVTLDRLRVTQDIALDGFQGSFATAGGLAGDFSGRVNGMAAVSGTVLPAPNGRAAIRIESDDAGGAFASAGLYASGRGGRMKVILQPRDEDGTYDGTLSIKGIRVVDAPELGSLLNAISVVGLINELEGAGIVFSDVEGVFLLTPDFVEIRQGSAIGASLGVSAEGLYRSGPKTISLQGVISPIYILNGIGQIFSRVRDGLFGFAYELEGSPERTKVSVNPLSILTPGMFRDLFRKEPPKIGD